MKLKDYPPLPESALPYLCKPDWLVGPVGCTGDSEALTRANFDALCNLLDDYDPYSNAWDVVRWSHWEVGWFEQIFVAPGSKCAEICEGAAEHLKKYAALDDALHEEYVAEEIAETEADKVPAAEGCT